MFGIIASGVRRRAEQREQEEKVQQRIAVLEQEVEKWKTLFYESEEGNCSCNIVDTTKPIGEPDNYVCQWHQEHPHLALERKQVISSISEAVREERERCAIALCDKCRIDGPPRDLIGVSTSTPAGDDGGPRFVHFYEDGTQLECDAAAIRGLSTALEGKDGDHAYRG